MANIYEQVPIDDEAQSGRYVLVAVSMRWLPYKPSSSQARSGIKGRWQSATEYGWENCSAPETYLRPIEADKD